MEEHLQILPATCYNVTMYLGVTSLGVTCYSVTTITVLFNDHWYRHQFPPTPDSLILENGICVFWGEKSPPH